MQGTYLFDKTAIRTEPPGSSKHVAGHLELTTTVSTVSKIPKFSRSPFPRKLDSIYLLSTTQRPTCCVEIEQ